MNRELSAARAADVAGRSRDIRVIDGDKIAANVGASR